MFERFTRATRMVVVEAVREAEAEEAAQVTGEHLLLALLRDGTRSGPVLVAAGLTRETMLAGIAAAHRRGGLTEAEAEALGELGIDVATVVDHIEAAHGENALATGPRRRSRHPSGHLPFTGQAKSLLVGALRQARERRARHIGDEHLLLAMASGTGVATQLLADHGLSYAELHTHLAQAS